MYDAKTILPSTYRGLIGPPRADGQLGFSSPDTIDIGERDMGDPQELKGFIEWAKQNYPADKFALILGSHGKGGRTLALTKRFLPARAKKWIGFTGRVVDGIGGESFEWIAFHACFMGAIEVAHQLQPFAKYLLASEEVADARDFPYQAMVQH